VSKGSKKVKFWADDPRSAWEYASQLEKQHRPRVALDKACLRLRFARPELSAVQRNVASGQLSALTAFESFRRQGYNLTREVIGGALAMLCRPMQTKFIPVGGDNEVHTACEQLTQLNDGIQESNRHFELVQRAVEDCMTCSVGAIKSYIDSKSEVRERRVDPLQLFWDQYEGEEPLTLIEQHAIPRRRALAMWPESRKAIEAAAGWQPERVPGVEVPSALSTPDTIKVIEAEVPRVGDLKGLRVWVIEGGHILAKQEVEQERHMTAVIRWENDFRTFGGVSLARGCAPYHAWTQRLVQTHYKQLGASVPIVWVHEDEELFKGITDLEMQIARFNGPKPPTVSVAATVSQDVVEQINYLRERCYQENGVNFSVSTGQKPVGLNSAPAQREHLETANLRIFPNTRRYERFNNDISGNNASLAAVAYVDKEARIRAPGSSFIGTIKWGEGPLKDLKESQYEARTSATSGLGLTVAGQMDDMASLRDLGVIDGEDIADKLNIPDIDNVRRLRLAPRRLAEKQCDDVLKHGVAVVPSPEQDRQRLLTIARLRLQDAKTTEIYPKANVQLLRRLIRNVEALLAPPPDPLAPVVPAPAPLSGLTAAPQGAAPLASAPLA
jgi:hypothetical protein